MSYKTELSSNFKKEAKKLTKKYPSLKVELDSLFNELEDNPTLGTSLGNNVYKIRLAIASKNKGKSGGARVMSFVKVVLYNKSGQALWASTPTGYADCAYIAHILANGQIYLTRSDGNYWSFDYRRTAGAHWVLQDDGNFVNYGNDGQGGTWDTGTDGGRRSLHFGNFHHFN